MTNITEALERAKTPKFKYADSYSPNDVRELLDDAVVLAAEVERLRAFETEGGEKCNPSRA
jgi:hypothetical protein